MNIITNSPSLTHCTRRRLRAIILSYCLAGKSVQLVHVKAHSLSSLACIYSWKDQFTCCAPSILFTNIFLWEFLKYTKLFINHHFHICYCFIFHEYYVSLLSVEGWITKFCCRVSNKYFHVRNTSDFFCFTCAPWMNVLAYRKSQ